MQSNTLKIGDIAPAFRLRAANFDREFSLPELLSRGPLIVEFLRGTW